MPLISDCRNPHDLDRDESCLRSGHKIGACFRYSLPLRRSSVLASAWAFFLSFREWPLSKSTLPLRHHPTIEK